MPTAVTIYNLGVWFCVGLFTSLGWSCGAWLVSRVLR